MAGNAEDIRNFGNANELILIVGFPVAQWLVLQLLIREVKGSISMDLPVPKGPYKALLVQPIQQGVL